MKGLFWRALAVVGLGIGAQGQAVDTQSNVIPGEYIVKYKEGFEHLASARPFFGGGLDVVKSFPKTGTAVMRVNRLMASPADDAATMAQLASMPGVEVVARNRMVSIAAVTPDDQYYGRQYGQNIVEMKDAWEVTTGSKSITVGIIDTGVDYNHPDLVDNIWTNPGESGTDRNGRDKATNGVDDDGNGYIDDVHGWDFANDDNDPMDDNSHGTHCAGTIGGRGNNQKGIAGVNWDVSIVPLKFITSAGSGSLDDAIAAIEYAITMKLDVTNNSWGGPGDQEEEKLMTAIVKKAQDIGQMFVVAAGNEGSNNDRNAIFPANIKLDNVIAVAATDSSDDLASFSNYGKQHVHVGAPGVGIVSTVPRGGYSRMDGTSMAAPYVAGAVALIKAKYPRASVKELRNRIVKTGDVLGVLDGMVASGARLNVYNGLTASSTTMAE